MGAVLLFTNGATAGVLNLDVASGGYASDSTAVGHDGAESGESEPLRDSVISVPEFATWAMMLAGYAALALAGRRRKAPARAIVSGRL